MHISRRQALTVLLPAAAFAVSGLPSIAVAVDSTTHVPAGYELVWNDEFHTLQLGNLDNAWLPYWGGWNVRHLAGNEDKGIKYADYKSLPGGTMVGDMLRNTGGFGPGPFLHEVSNATLKLRCFPVPAATQRSLGFPYIASMISGEKLPAQRQDYWETRLRLPRMGPGLHFAVWLLNNKFEWPPEIDIVEMVGQHPPKFAANTHLSSGTPPPITFYEAPNRASGWHVFGFEWTDSTIRWTVDGIIVREHAALLTTDKLYIIFSWEVSGAAAPWPAQVDAGLKAQGMRSSMRLLGWPLARASSVALR